MDRTALAAGHFMMIAILAAASGCATPPSGGWIHEAENGERWALYVFDDAMCFSFRTAPDGLPGSISVGRFERNPDILILHSVNALRADTVPPEEYRWALENSRLLIYVWETPLVLTPADSIYPGVMHLLSVSMEAARKSEGVRQSQQE